MVLQGVTSAGLDEGKYDEVGRLQHGHDLPHRLARVAARHVRIALALRPCRAPSRGLCHMARREGRPPCRHEPFFKAYRVTGFPC